ncbi:subtilisin family serine protease [Rhodopseudomonas rhenobacensis]|uniref:Subtilisin family serine protease n=1 Tax=Rhodopseudomonas rhenobacensis TaxID=87461 RepID=A0A7W7Z0L3_9BRAD|nr:S8 family serine peptidase [Rhodopseudomonas rhenobacensis]MBB5045776.1 subtilisin family serine protease [Rhodopseudomonas rhenobacensis]
MASTENGNRRFPEPTPPQPTGRTLVLLHRGAEILQAQNRIENTLGLRAFDAREFAGSTTAMAEALSGGAAVILPRFSVAVLPEAAGAGARAQLSALAASDEVRQVRPEFFMFATSERAQRYHQWVRDGLVLLAEEATSVVVTSAEAPATLSLVSTSPAPFADNDQFTWGLQAIGADKSAYTGRGIRIAVLDTGLDLEHPDFKGRAIVSQSFVGGDAMDVHGHGTHTAGTIAGPKQSSIGRRYGVAPDVELYVGKVLSDNGSGREGDILNGMNWAIESKCAAISMSLGRGVRPGEKPDVLYEEVGAAALAEGCLIIAAAGNDSARDFGLIAPVNAPGNSTTVMAVAALDPKMRVAPFSCGSINPDGGHVDIAAPGVAVYSTAPRPQLSRILQGTSMACPHVAGLAALFAQSDSSLRGQKLWDALVQKARSLGNESDLGAGLAQAPDAGA